ncbi:MAG: low-specificity L-threonine aldolase [Burkholderiales bacterium]|jgi:threonine aldolase|nr:low-specificity L-threonine aldolase [Burkholderiales bacterium]
MTRRIDLRSDTVTLPTAAMRAAMTAADVGDDVYGEDPTVNRLEGEVASLFGKAAAVYVATGTQSNLIGLMAHCERGDEYIVGQLAHTYKYEGGGAAVLGSIQPQPIDNEADGTLDLDRVVAAIKPAGDAHFARTRLLALENTIGGRVLPLDYLARAESVARARGLAMHLDGARVFNAAVKLAVPVKRIADHFDTVSICLSKGLGAPMGSVLVGPTPLIERARRWRKVLGGGMRQVGLMAAAGRHALAHHVERLADDHANARRLAERLAQIDGIAVDPAKVQTNMVYATFPADVHAALKADLQRSGIVLPAGPVMRLVTHLDITTADVDQVADAIAAWMRHRAAAPARVAA